MKTLLAILCVIAVVSVALADKPVQTIDNPIDRIECSFENVTYDWDFAVNDWGFATGPCDDGGVPTWEYGTSIYWPNPLWATSLTTDADELYPNDAGESLLSPNFIVDDSAYLVEVFHGYYIEASYDGCNLSVNGVVIEPMVDPYPDDEISDSEAYYAWCVDGEPGFTGGQVTDVYSCFDLSGFMGEEVQLSFDFGSDSSAQYPGWYIASVRVGGNDMTALPDEEVPNAGLRLAVHPNPFNPQTTITFALDKPQRAESALYDLTGRLLIVLADRTYTAGEHSVVWHGNDAMGRALPSGTYVVRLETDSGVEARKVLLLR